MGTENKVLAFIHDTAVIAPGARIAKNVEIGPYSVIGENVEYITRQFPHWFCQNFTKYSKRELALPFDQHELLALVAPRNLYVASATADRWADPKGEYLSAYHASPVFELYGLKGMTSKVQPKVGEDVQNDVGYHIREGKHNILPYDWSRYINFCDKIFKKR